MSEQFFYPEFKLPPKRGTVTVTVGKAQEVVLEVPRKLIEEQPWERVPYESPTIAHKGRWTKPLRGMR
jgi:hypothetical protein